MALSNIPILGIIIRAHDEASKDIEKVGKSIQKLSGLGGALPVSGGLAALGAAAGVAAAGMGVAAIEMAKNIAETAERLNRLSTTTGTSVANLQVLETAFKNVGIAPEVAIKGLVRLERAIGNNDPLLKKLGITTQDAYEAMLQLSDVFEKSGTNSQQVAIAAKLLGRGMADAAGTVRGLRHEIEETNVKMREAGALLEGDALKSALKMEHAFNDLGISIAGIKTQVALAFLPVMLDLTTKLNTWMTRNSDDVKAFAVNTGRALEAAFIYWSDFFGRLRGLQLRFEDGLLGTQEILNVMSGQVTQNFTLKARHESIERELAAIDQTVKEHAERWKNIWKDRPTISPETGGPLDSLTGKPVEITVELKPKRAPGVEDDAIRDEFGNILGKQQESAREKQLKSIRDLLRGSKADAEAFLGVLEAVESAAKSEKLRADISAALDIATPADIQRALDAMHFSVKAREVKIGDDVFTARVTKDLENRIGALHLKAIIEPAIGVDPKDIKLRMPKFEMPTISEKIPEADIAGWDRIVDDLLARFGKIDEGIVDITLSWTKAIEDMTSAAGVLDASFGAIFNGLEAGFGQVFANLGNKAQTFRSSMATIFRAIVDQALRELARLAAAKLFGFLLKLFGFATGGPVGAAVGAAVGTIMGGSASSGGTTEQQPAGYSARPADQGPAMAGPAPHGPAPVMARQAPVEPPAPAAAPPPAPGPIAPPRPAMAASATLAAPAGPIRVSVAIATPPAPRPAPAPLFRLPIALPAIRVPAAPAPAPTRAIVRQVEVASRAATMPRPLMIRIAPEPIRARPERVSEVAKQVRPAVIRLDRLPIPAPGRLDRPAPVRVTVNIAAPAAKEEQRQTRGAAKPPIINNYNISAISALDLVEQLSPGGNLREAMDRISLAGAY